MTTLRLASALVATALLSSTAMAADLAHPQVIPAAPHQNTVYNWSGSYVGAFADYGFGSDDASVRGTNTAGMLDVKGFGGGIHVGHNYQTGNVVFGIEADVMMHGMEDSVTNAALFGGTTASAKYNWFATVRPRIGYAIDRFMIYATAGIAAGGVEYNTIVGDGSGSLRSKTTRFGLAAGAGAEYAITDNISLRAEYMYVNLETERFTFGLNRTTSIAESHHIRVGASYKF